MIYVFTNSTHGTAARAASKDYRLTQRQIISLWRRLCGDLSCECGLAGVEGKNRWRLKKGLFCEGADVYER